MVCPPGLIGRRPESIPILKNIAMPKNDEGKEDLMGDAFMQVDDVANELGVSKSYAYKLVQKLNAELNEKGYLTIAGRVNKKFFLERMCYSETSNTERKG